MRSPDPIATVNLYAAGRLDAALVEVGGAVRARWRQLDPHGRLWTMRYAKRGEHLKLRLHGAAELALEAASLVAEIADAWLAGLPVADPGAQRKSLPYAAPIDAEDSGDDDVADRGWLATSYRRHPISLGAVVDDDAHVARMVACFSAATDLIVDTLDLVGNGFDHRRVQRLMLNALIAGLAELDSDDGRVAYLTYHRDWLLRSRLRHAGIDRQETGDAFLARFDGVSDRLGGALDRIGETAVAAWSGAADSEAAGGELRRAVSILFAGLADGSRIDPFAADPRFPFLFKIFHCLANQLGLDRINEALPFHMLARAIGAKPAIIRFVPAPTLDDERPAV